MEDTFQNSMYHRVLRVAAVVCALVLLFESGIVSSSTAVLALNTRLYVANAVGMSTTVEPTELNMFTAELTAQKKRLDDREADLKERELEIGLNAASSQSQNTTYVLASMLFILLVLIVLNYILDFVRAREATKKLTTQTV